MQYRWSLGIILLARSVTQNIHETGYMMMIQIIRPRHYQHAAKPDPDNMRRATRSRLSQACLALSCLALHFLSILIFVTRRKESQHTLEEMNRKTGIEWSVIYEMRGRCAWGFCPGIGKEGRRLRWQMRRKPGPRVWEMWCGAEPACWVFPTVAKAGWACMHGCEAAMERRAGVERGVIGEWFMSLVWWEELGDWDIRAKVIVMCGTSDVVLPLFVVRAGAG